jgi:hypothetical protein
MMPAMRAWIALWIVGALAGAAQAEKPKLAALILQSGGVDEELADNLTEVLIARIARRGDHEIAGKEEFKTRLGVNEQSAAACIDNPGCLGRVGTELGVTRVVVGTLGLRGSDYLYNLSLIDITSGKIENRVFELVASGKVDLLIAAVQATSDKLFLPKVEPGGVRVGSETRGAMVYLDDAFIGSAPVRRDGIEPGSHQLRVEKEGHLGWAKEVDVPPGSTLEIKVPLAALPKRRAWPGAFAVACLAVAGGAVVIGIVLVALSGDAPADSAVTRRAAVDSADRRYLEDRTGWGFGIMGAALAVTAGAIAIKYRHDIFPPKEKPRALVTPTGNGVQVSW